MLDMLDPWEKYMLGVLVLVGFSVFCLVGLARRKEPDAPNKKCHIVLYSASGTVIREWTMKSPAVTRGSSSNFAFYDEQGRYVEVMGTAVRETE